MHRQIMPAAIMLCRALSRCGGRLRRNGWNAGCGCRLCACRHARRLEVLLHCWVSLLRPGAGPGMSAAQDRSLWWCASRIGCPVCGAYRQSPLGGRFCVG